MSSLFEHVNATVRHAKSGTAIGVVTHGDRALLIDSGLDENLVRKVVNALQAEGVSVAAIVNTHAHADHIGGNAFAVKRTGARVVAPEVEHVFVEHPELEPYTLYGAPPPSWLRGKFVQAPPSRVDEVVPAAGERDVAGFRVRFHELGGHSVRQMGVEVDGVLFAGDALLPESVLQKYGLVFAVDPRQMAESCRRVAALGVPVVSYHGGLVGDVEGAARANAEAVARAEGRILARLAKGGATTDDLVVEVVEGTASPSLELHALHAATVRGYLATLERAGRVETVLEENHITWRLRP